jgi:hypothetical protein
VEGDENWIPEGTVIRYKIVVTNCGDVTLTDIELTDQMWKMTYSSYPNLYPVKNPHYNEGDLSYPSSLDPGDSFEIVLGPFDAEDCWHKNVVSATALSVAGGVQDSDHAWYKAYR